MGAPLAEVWNGTSWSVQPVPSPRGATFTTLIAVACRPAGGCATVGTLGRQVSNTGLSASQTLAEAEP